MNKRSNRRERGRAGGVVLALVIASLVTLTACSDESTRLEQSTSESCMHCHNASPRDDYSGPGIENPHPFPGADNLLCTTCHGGNPLGVDRLTSHIPPPPEIGDRQFQDQNRFAYFNKLTLTGIDKLPDYQVDGVPYTALQYLRFLNPGDLRVVTQGQGCGQCHAGHASSVAGSLLATEAGILAGGTYAAGVEGKVATSRGLHLDTAADVGFRAVTDPHYQVGASEVGTVGELLEFPVISAFGAEEADSLYDSDLYLAGDLADDQNADGSVISDSPLAHLWEEQLAFTCGDCHLGSSGANNRYGDFRPSGCSACHMPYSLSGRSGSNDPNIDKLEPLDPDDIDDPERPHVRSHRIVSTFRSSPSGETVPGIDDHACAGCHQGSNRTVMQFWGIRLDQNQDLRRGFQYPAAPAAYENSRDDPRLFDPEVDNRTFNGRNHHQYIVFEDYDGDGRDDTPEDVHYEAGMGCIDCHGSYDLHGPGAMGAAGDAIKSRMEQGVAIRCESCHGDAEAYASVVTGTAFDGVERELAVDSKGNPLDHVVRESDGKFWLTSRLDGARHFVSQTRDLVVDTGEVHPETDGPLFSPRASYAMGRDDDNPATGIGPQQNGLVHAGFSHADNLDCAACHSSWTNTCMGCHLEGEYTTNNNNFSNITGERIVFRQAEAQFVYQSPVFFQLGVGPKGKITQFSPNSKTFFRYQDKEGDRSKVFAFTDRNGGGNNPTAAYPSMSHNAMMAHSIRGRVTPENEGARSCVACHLTDDALADYGAEYLAFRTALAGGDFGALDYDLLAEHFGRNPGNQLNSPLWVHAVAGLGSGLFLFDVNGCAVNRLDENEDRYGCDGEAPAGNFLASRVFFDLDRIVDAGGVSQGGNKHPFLDATVGPGLRDGALVPGLGGPLGANLIGRLTDPGGIVLDSWIDADGQAQGHASDFVGDP